MHKYIINIKYIFYLLFGCPVVNFRPLSRGQPDHPDVDQCISYNNFDPKETGSLVTRLGPKA